VKIIRTNFFIIGARWQISLYFHLYLALMDFTFLIAISNGDKPFIAEFISIFESSVIANIEKMKDDFENGKFEVMQKLAHQIKPTTEMLGFETQNDIVAINKNARDASLEQINKIVLEAHHTLAELKKTFLS
jgi:HPt (histidine-containing phosphotransfer) domain-containing protein